MTVITKPISENKVEKPLEKALMACVDADTGKQHCMNVGVDMRPCGAAGGTDQQSADFPIDWWTWAYGVTGDTRQRRLSATATVCVFVAVLVITSGAIIGGVYIYRQCTYTQQMSRFRGWCGVPLERNTLRMIGHHSISKTGSHWPSAGHTDGIFNEQFDLDLGSEEHEEIYVPDFGIGRTGYFVHDFKVNLTGIVDEETNRCFVSSLDTAQVVTPRNMMHIMSKMWDGFHQGNMVVVRQTLRVIRPPISDLSTTGPHIARLCRDHKTYRLEKVTSIFDQIRRRSRSVGDEQEEEAVRPYTQTDSHFTVVEFAGKAIVEFTILDE